MKVERVKYVIWAVDPKRAVRFYREVFGGEVLKESEVISEVSICGATIGIHGGGEGKRTWTGLSFQVADVIAGARRWLLPAASLPANLNPKEVNRLTWQCAWTPKATNSCSPANGNSP